MLSKVALLFLVAMGVLALFGRLRFPPAIRRRLTRRDALPAPRKCPRCQRFLIGKGDCTCNPPPGA